MYAYSEQIGASTIVAGLVSNSYYSGAAVSAVTSSAVANGTGIIGNCDNITGTGVYGESVGLNSTGVGGICNAAAGANSGTGVYGGTTQGGGAAAGVYGENANAAGSGIIAVNSAGNGAGAGEGLYAQTGQSTTGAVSAFNVNASGTGILGTGNNAVASYLVGGSGGAFTGSTTGCFGFSRLNGNGSFGGYFNTAVANSWAYVGGRTGGTNYKINGPGSVSTVVDRPDGSHANMFCPESPEILFQDFGSGKLIDGKATIKLDEIFSNNIYVDDAHPLRVFIQLEGNCNGVYVTNKSATAWIVIDSEKCQLSTFLIRIPKLSMKLILLLSNSTH